MDGLWFDNEHTVRGSVGHLRADAAPSRQERGVQVLRHIPLWSERHGLTGRADVVTLSPAGEVPPVEYKIGTPHGQTAQLQLCAQALCLEEMFGCLIPAGAIWYSCARHRTRVEFDDSLREQTLTTVAEIRSWLCARVLPAPHCDDRCRSCQFLDDCQPELSSQPDRVTQYIAAWIRCVS